MWEAKGGRGGACPGGGRKVPVGDQSPPPWEETDKAGRRGGTYTQSEPQYWEGEESNFPGYSPTPEDLRLKEICGDRVHAKAGYHLHRGVADDVVWKGWR